MGIPWRGVVVDAIDPGRKEKVPGLERRHILVITEQGKPSYVTGGTVERRYNDRYN